MVQARAQNPGLGALFMLAAGAVIALASLLVMAVGAGHPGLGLHPLQVGHGCCYLAFSALSVVVALMRPPSTRVHCRLHVLCTGLGWSGVTPMVAAVAFIPPGDAMAISFLNPVVAMVLSVPLLAERVGRIRWFAAAFGLAGAVILPRLGGAVADSVPQQRDRAVHRVDRGLTGLGASTRGRSLLRA
jgi:hypothetical protein